MNAIGISVGIFVALAALALVAVPSSQRRSQGVTIFRRMVVVVAVAGFFGLCLAMLGRYTGYRSPFFALIAVADILGFVALTRAVLPWGLPRPLRPLRAWERTEKLYRLLGAAWFGMLIRVPPFRYLDSTVYLGARRGELAQLRSNVLRAEGAHFWGTLLTFPLLAYWLLNGWWDSLLCVAVFHVVLNLYPVIHLRLVRARIERLSNGTIQ
jgi:hypothetical protein